jgi:hypothetical protein
MGITCILKAVKIEIKGKRSFREKEVLEKKASARECGITK